MQDGFDDGKEEQQSREDETKESTESELVEDMKKISDDKYMIKDSGQDDKNSEVVTSNCVVAQTLRLQECLLYFTWEDQDKTVIYLPSMLHKNYSAVCG